MHAASGPLSEEEAWQIALNDHPEYRQGVEDGTLPEELRDEEGETIDPRLHLMLHSIIEQQLAADEPPGVAEIGRQLAALGISHHDIRHAIAGPLTEQLWLMQTEGVEFDAAAYLKQLRAAVESLR